MSLLNDALRAAEQRQKRPSAPGAYVGEQQPPRDGKPLLLIAVAMWALLVTVMAGYWMFAGGSSPQPRVVASEPIPNQRIQRMATVVVDQRPEHEPVGVLIPVPQPESVPSAPVAAAPLAPASAVPSPPMAKLRAKQEPIAAKIIAVKAAEAPPENVAPAAVKSVPETPAATDRSSARQLERLVAQGNISAAERGLAALTQAQAAPRSRYVVARALLVEGKLEQALGWLPEQITAEHPRLRLLKARALHANNNLAAAVDTLSSNVPPVQDSAEYRVTLATLQQQQGENAAAARYWAELIAWDDSQAPWWVGLAIALEAQGEQAGAVRAYRQAAALPGLPGSLADYVRQRLQALQAG